MATLTLENISKDLLRWAFQRAGLSETQAISLFPPLEDWLNDVSLPTPNQLREYAEKVKAPYGFLFLKEVPEESQPFPIFHGLDGPNNHFDLDVYDTALEIGRRQDWLEDYLIEDDIDTCQFVGSLNPNDSISDVVEKLRDVFKVNHDWSLGLKDAKVALNFLTFGLEEAGVFVSYSDIVGNNPRRSLSIGQCRGFALANKTAPYIFVNSSYSPEDQLYTLINECVHLMVGQSAGHACDCSPSANSEEIFCDQVTLEFLIPKEIFLAGWNNGDLISLSKDLKVNELLIARRAHNLGLLSDNDYRTFLKEYNPGHLPKNKHGEVPDISAQGNSEEDFYQTNLRRIGRRFAILVNIAVQNRLLSYTEAYRLTGMCGSAYKRFMKEIMTNSRF